MRFDDGELSLIKNTFAEADALLKAVRSHMLQMPLREGDDVILSVFKDNAALQHVVSKTFLPELDPDAPFGQLVDLYMTVDIKEIHPEVAALRLNARRMLIDYLRQQLVSMFGAPESSTDPVIQLEETLDFEGETASDVYTEMTFRNTAVMHVEQQILQLYMLAGSKDEDVEATKERLAKDSMK